MKKRSAHILLIGWSSQKIIQTTEDNRLELLNFLQILEKGFVTDKMRGCYEDSLTLQEIVDGVAKYNGYRIVSPLQAVFVVAGCTDHGSTL